MVVLVPSTCSTFSKLLRLLVYHSWLFSLRCVPLLCPLSNHQPDVLHFARAFWFIF